MTSYNSDVPFLVKLKRSKTPWQTPKCKLLCFWVFDKLFQRLKQKNKLIWSHLKWLTLLFFLLFWIVVIPKNFASKGELNSEWIYESQITVSPKMPTKNLKDFCPGSFLEGRAEILKIFGWHFGRNDDLINLFWI